MAYSIGNLARLATSNKLPLTPAGSAGLTRNPLLRPQEPIGMTIWSTRHYHSGGSKSGGDQDITRLPIVVLKRLAETPDLTNGIRGGFVHRSLSTLMYLSM